MYQKLREEYPDLKKVIKPIAKIIKERYPIVVSFEHPMIYEIGGLIRGYTRAKSVLSSEKPLTGTTMYGLGLSGAGTYFNEPARLLYIRLKDLKSEFRLEYNHINIYAETLDQAREWISWGLEQQAQYPKMSNWFHYIKAVDNNVEIGEIVRKQTQFRDLKFYVKFKDYYFEDLDQENQFKEIMRTYREDHVMNYQLTKFVEFSSKKSKHGFQASYPPSLYQADMYAKDTGSVMFLQLSFPQVIKKIYRVKYMGK